DHGEFPAKGVDDLLALCELKELVEVAVITVHRDGHGSETDLENLISGFEAHDIPTEVIWPKYWSLEKEKAIQGE
ncbi:MAG: hypothetical protein QF389_09185, partial [Planctomycetota bacterium]|nr:hypothetical protein [Planctomycetota bacterium]